jgi:magnesium transporter
MLDVHQDQVGDGGVPAARWVDLAAPSEAELAEAEALLGNPLPREVHDTSLEPSRRLRHDGDYLVMTVTLPPPTGGGHSTHATFILGRDSLVTVRSAGAGPFATAQSWGAGDGGHVRDPFDALLHIFEEITSVAADRLEELAAEIEEETSHVFDTNRSKRRRAARIERLVAALGDQGTRLLKQRECLSGLSRTILFLTRRSGSDLVPAAAHNRLSVLLSDVHALLDHAASLDTKIGFLLDAVLGLVSLDQNDVMKMLSVTAAIFMPPTLISSIYGMNFEVMPDLSWQWGFYATLGIMAVSAAVTWAIFRWRRWL